MPSVLTVFNGAIASVLNWSCPLAELMSPSWQPTTFTTSGTRTARCRSAVTDRSVLAATGFVCILLLGL